MVFPQARLGFVCAEAGAADRVETDEIGGERRAGIGRIDALLVEPMPGLVRRAEDGSRKVVPVVARGDPHVIARKRHLERMHRGIETPALEIISELLGEAQAKGALPLLGIVAEQEVRTGLRAATSRRRGSAAARPAVAANRALRLAAVSPGS